MWLLFMYFIARNTNIELLLCFGSLIYQLAELVIITAHYSSAFR